MASSKKALLGALVANLAIAATKFIVGAITTSTVMIAEGIHSLVDTGNSGLMLLGGRRSKRPPTPEHPFGHGMELYFWTLVVAMVVFGGGGGLSIYEGIDALIHPRQMTALWANYLTIIAAAVFEGSSLVIGRREFASYRRERRFRGSTLDAIRASKNPSMFLVVLEDSAALIGLAIAAIGVTLSHYLHMPMFDGIASILIGMVLMGEALLLGIECRGLISGEAARPLIQDRIRKVTELHKDVGTVEELRTLQLGPEWILVFLRLRFPDTIEVRQLAQRVQPLVADLQRVVPEIKDVAFELAPRPPQQAPS